MSLYTYISNNKQEVNMLICRTCFQKKQISAFEIKHKDRECGMCYLERIGEIKRKSIPRGDINGYKREKADRSEKPDT